MKAIILAAGRGSRLHPYTADCPKCLTELAGTALIDWQIAALRHVGVDDIVIVTGFMAERLALPGTRQVQNADWADTNMVESLFCARDEFEEGMVVSYSDIVYEPRMLEALNAASHDVAVVVDRRWRDLWEFRFDDPLSDAESLKMDRSGQINDIGNPVKDIDTIEAQYTGLMKFSGKGIEALDAARASWNDADRDWMAKRPVRKAYMTDLLMEMILLGKPVHAVPVDGGWLEIDTVSDYERVQELVSQGTIGRFFDPTTLAEITDG